MENIVQKIKENKKIVIIILSILVIILGYVMYQVIFKKEKEEEKIIHYTNATIYNDTYTYGQGDNIYIENVLVDLKVEEGELVAEYNNGEEMITLDISGIEESVKSFTYYNNYYLEIIALTEDGNLYGWSESPDWDWNDLFDAEMEFKKVSTIEKIEDITLKEEKDKATNNSKKLCAITNNGSIKVVNFSRSEDGTLQSISVGKTYEQNYPWMDSMNMQVQYITSTVYLYKDRTLRVDPSLSFVTDETKQPIHAKAVYMNMACRNGDDSSECDEDEYVAQIYIITTNNKLYLLLDDNKTVDTMARPVNGKTIKKFTPSKSGHYERKEKEDTGDLTKIETPVITFDDKTQMTLNVDQYYIYKK